MFVLDDVAACGQRAARLCLAFRAGLAVCIALFCLLASSPAAFSQSATLTISPATYTGAGVTMTYSIRITPGSVNIRSINATSSNIKGVPITCDAIPPSGFVIPFNCRGSYVTTATDNTTGQFGDNIRFTGTRTGGNFDFTTNYATATKQGGGGTSTSVSSSPNPALPGQTVLIRARVSSMGCDGGQAPSGSVKITVGPQSTTAGLNYSRPDRAGDSYADFSTATLPVGNHAVTAEFLGNAACDRSTATGSNLIVNTRPNVTINNGAGQASPTGAAPVNFTAVFERAVTGFSRTGVQLSGTAGATTATVSGSGTTYTIAVSGMTRSGTVIATIPEGVASASGLTNLASTSTSNSVDFVVISVSPGVLPNAAYNTSYAQALSATGGTGPYAFALHSGALPTGMSISNGQVSGTPTQSGTFNFVVRATDANAINSTQAFSLVVMPPSIAVTPTTLTAATVGLPYSQTLSASGAIAPYRFTRTGGALPAGLQLDEQSGTVSGTPTAGGSFGFTITAADANDQTGARAYTLTVDPAAIVLPATTLANGIVGTAYSAMINPASGGTAPYTYAVTGGALPSGMALGSTGQISGTTATPGVHDFTVTARDGSTGTGPYTGTRSYRLTITDTPPVANPASATVAYGSGANAITLSFGGGVATSVAVASPPAHGVALPSGTSITYQPVPGYAGSRFLHLYRQQRGRTIGAGHRQHHRHAAGDGGRTHRFIVGAGRQAVHADFHLHGRRRTLHAGRGNRASGGSRRQRHRRERRHHFRNADRGRQLPARRVGNRCQHRHRALSCQRQYHAPGGGADADAVAGRRRHRAALRRNLLAGLHGVRRLRQFQLCREWSIACRNGFFRRYAERHAETARNLPISIVATDATTGSGAPFSVSNSYSLTVAAPNLGITPGALTDATAGASYSVQLSANGGVAPYGYVLQSGRLPNGLTLIEGVISGTPTEAGSFPLTIQATDAFGQSASIGYALGVRVPAFSLAPVSLPQGTAGRAYSQTISATGGIAPYRYALSGSLPSGLGFDPGTGELRGTPTQAGSFAVSIEVTDSTGGTPAKVTQGYTLVVATPEVSVTPSSLPGGLQGTPYAATIAASGGIAPYTYQVSGSLPGGVGLDRNTGVLERHAGQGRHLQHLGDGHRQHRGNARHPDGELFPGDRRRCTSRVGRHGPHHGRQAGGCRCHQE
ncbi:putative Ig domain-containing protein [Mesorhizobium sp. UC22_110]|uniref:putative Ig domain-containing protein n=1 Tax=Mesorhizobium sp. UC22_110 TaxID=3374552 RepID=UPI003756F1D1